MKLIISIMVLFSFSAISAGTNTTTESEYQKKEHKISKSNGFLVVEELNSIHVLGYEGSEVIISRNVKEKEEVSDRAKGLNLVNSLGLNDNTGLGLNIREEGDHIYISEVSSACCEDEVTIKVPHGLVVELSKSSMSGGTYRFENVKNEIVASTNYGNIELVNVTGPAAVKSVYGTIEANINKLSQEGSVSLYSVYGLVDLTLPQTADSNIEIATPYGKIYTDMDIQVDKDSDGYTRISKREIKGKLNEGGVHIKLHSSYAAVYLRKS